MMYRTTIHIAFFGLIYGSPDLGNVQRSIKVCIGFITTIIAFKMLVGSFPYVLTLIAGLTCIGGFYYYNRNSIKLSFILDKLSKLGKAPITKFLSKLFISFLRVISNTCQVFKGNTLTLFFSKFNNLFCNRMISNSGVCSFFPAKPFQKFTRTSCAFGLNRTTNLLSFLTNTVKFLRRCFLSVRSNRNICNTKIYTNKLFNILNVFFRNLDSLTNKEFTFFINQVSLSLNVGKIVSVMTDKWDLLSSTYTPNRNGIVRFITKYSRIISNSTVFSKSSLFLSVNFIRISYFTDTTYKHLSRKIKRPFERMVNFVMKLILIKQLLVPSYFRHSITCSISLFKSIKKEFRLLFGRKEFHFKSKLHTTKTNITKEKKSFKCLNFFVKKYYLIGACEIGRIPPTVKTRGFPAKILL